MVDWGPPVGGASERQPGGHGHQRAGDADEVPDPELTGVLTKVRSLLLGRRPADAAELALEGLHRYPNSVPLLEELAQAQRMLGNYPGAIEVADAARALDPGALTASLVLADSYSLGGDHGAALAAADTAVELAPDVADTYFVRAKVRNRGVSWFAMWVRTKRTRDEIRQVLIDVDRAIELDPADPRFHTLRGAIEARRENKTAAGAAFTEALQIDPLNPVALAGRGEVDIDQLRLSDARKEVSAAALLDPGSPDIQRRAHQLVRMRVLLPLWVATLTPSLAFFAWLLIGHASAIITGIVVGGTVASFGFVVWWWRRRLTASDRHQLVRGKARRVLVISFVLWVLLTLAGLLFLDSSPTIELWNPSGADPAASPQMSGIDLVAILCVAFAGAGIVGAVYMWFYAKYYRAATRLSGRMFQRSDKRAGRT